MTPYTRSFLWQALPIFSTAIGFSVDPRIDPRAGRGQAETVSTRRCVRKIVFWIASVVSDRLPCDHRAPRHPEFAYENARVLSRPWCYFPIGVVHREDFPRGDRRRASRGQGRAQMWTWWVPLCGWRSLKLQVRDDWCCWCFGRRVVYWRILKFFLFLWIILERQLWPSII